jgi:hypothetical protein
MSNQSPEWQAMTKLVGQFYAKADAGELILFVEFVKILFGRGGRGRYPTQKMALSSLFGGEWKDRSRLRVVRWWPKVLLLSVPGTILT